MREISYNKKEHLIGKVECLPNSLPKGAYLQTLILMNECHFFITITKVVSRNKMIVMYRKTLITKVLLVIIIKPPFFQKEGRHSTMEHSLYNYKSSYINKN